MAMDVLHDPASMDLLSPIGFVSALYHATCLRPGSGFLAAPVCSSFVYMQLGLGNQRAGWKTTNENDSSLKLKDVLLEKKGLRLVLYMYMLANCSRLEICYDTF